MPLTRNEIVTGYTAALLNRVGEEPTITTLAKRTGLTYYKTKKALAYLVMFGWIKAKEEPYRANKTKDVFVVLPQYRDTFEQLFNERF